MERAERFEPKNAPHEPRDISDLRRLARELDSKFELPGGIRVGWDALIGLIPGVGDLVTNAMSFYILFRAADLGCPPSVLMRMGLNVLIDNIFDAIPFLGNIFDVFYKSNTKNLELIERYTREPSQTTRTSRAVVFGVLFVLAVVLITLAGLAFWGAYLLVQYLNEPR